MQKVLATRMHHHVGVVARLLLRQHDLRGQRAVVEHTKRVRQAIFDHRPYARRDVQVSSGKFEAHVGS